MCCAELSCINWVKITKWDVVYGKSFSYIHKFGQKTDSVLTQTCSVSLWTKFFSGVLCDITTVGVAKNLYQMDEILCDNDQKCRMSLLHEPGDYFTLKASSANMLGLVSLFVRWWCVSDMHKHTNISILLTRLLGGWWFGVEGQGIKSGSTAHVPPSIFIYKNMVL